MYLEDYEIEVGLEKYKVIHCKGEGQSSCSHCKKRSWTSWFYKISEKDEDILCFDCISEFFIQQRIRNEINKLVSYFETALVFDNKNKSFTKKEILGFLSDAIMLTKIGSVNQDLKERQKEKENVREKRD